MSDLVIRGLRAEIDGKEILKGIDLEISKGQIHAIMGPNGSGKSTWCCQPIPSNANATGWIWQWIGRRRK